jgi:hypothetical protein
VSPSVWLAALLAVLSRAVTFRCGAWRISVADTSGKPVHLTYTLARDAIVQALADGAGTLRSGSTVVTIEPWNPVPPAA